MILATVYSQLFQLFKGRLNEVAEALSCDHQLPDAKLLNIFHSLIPEQIPSNFRICRLLPDVISQIMTWLHSLPPSTKLPKAPEQSKLATGAIGKPTSKPLNLMMAPSSPHSQGVNNTDWSQRTFAATVRANDVQSYAGASMDSAPVSSTVCTLSMWLHRPTGLTASLA
jgi:hypothetical protein